MDSNWTKYNQQPGCLTHKQRKATPHFSCSSSFRKSLSEFLGLLQGMPGCLLQSDGRKAFSSPLKRKKGLVGQSLAPAGTQTQATAPAAIFGQSQAPRPSVPAPDVDQPAREDSSAEQGDSSGQEHHSQMCCCGFVEPSGHIWDLQLRCFCSARRVPFPRG